MGIHLHVCLFSKGEQILCVPVYFQGWINASKMDFLYSKFFPVRDNFANKGWIITNAEMRPLEVVYQFILGKKRKKERKNCKDKEKAHLSPAAAFNFTRFETDVKNIKLVSFNIKMIRRHRKHHRNGDACRANLTCFWLSLINMILKDTKDSCLCINL